LLALGNKKMCTFAQDQLFALQTHHIWPGGDEYVTMDFFRFL
jgi:predicted SnoaL-like aldol condensation-catalyzing enzyme